MALTKLTTDLIDGSLGTDWDSTVQTGNFGATAGAGYFVDTTSAAITVTLPSSPTAGDEVSIIDYGANASTNNITITSSDNIEGAADDLTLSTDKVSKTLVYSDATKGWLVATEVGAGAAAAAGPYDIDYLLVAGGGGGGGRRDTGTGGGGAGGLLQSTITSISIGDTLTISLGAGGAGGVDNTSHASPGTDSYISGTSITTITANGGGYGASYLPGGVDKSGGNGGSGGGGSYGDGGGTGTAGPPRQGYDGGSGDTGTGQPAGGGGGAGEAGGNGGNATGGSGGDGITTTIISTSNATSSSVGEVSASSLYFAGGGGGGVYPLGSVTAGTGGLGGGADGTYNAASNNGSPNTGGGAGGNGASPASSANGGTGGSGVCILRMPTASYSGTTTGSPDVYTEGSDTVLVYKTAGTYTT